MIKASLLRISAQKYATGKISKGDYLRYRNELCDAIENGDPLPEIPDEWLNLVDSPINPELQTLMTQLHELDEKEYSKPGMPLWQKLGIIAIGLLLVILIGWFLFSTDKVATTPQSAPMQQINNPFLQQSRKLIPQANWNNNDVINLIEQWQKLGKMEQTALKRHTIVQQLKQEAIKQQKTASPLLKDSIYLLLQAIK